jgi:hypothetical protein
VKVAFASCVAALRLSSGSPKGVGRGGSTETRTGQRCAGEIDDVITGRDAIAIKLMNCISANLAPAVTPKTLSLAEDIYLTLAGPLAVTRSLALEKAVSPTEEGDLTSPVAGFYQNCHRTAQSGLFARLTL